MASIAQSVAAVRERIAAAEHRFGRSPDSVRLLAVSKAQPLAAVQAAHRAGLSAFGENYLQEALLKIEALRGAEWHFIGPIQSNKTRAIAANFAWVHSLDRLKIARRLSAQRSPELPPLEVCLEVNLSGEATKSGVGPDALPELALAVAELPRLRLRGLMVVPAPTQDFDAQRTPFRQLRELLSQLNEHGLGLDTLSMGMSADLEAAIAEGSTIVRIGTAIFGARPPK